MKKIFSFIAAAALCTQAFNFKADAVKKRDKDRFYNRVISIKGEFDIQYDINIQAYNDGLITILILKQSFCTAKNYIGQIGFSVDMVDLLTNEVPSPYGSPNPSKIVEEFSYNQNDITYDFYDNSETMRQTSKRYYTYVKEPYMNSIIPMDIFGAHIEIPFDTKEYDAEKQLTKVEKELYSLKQENAFLIEERDTLLKENETLKNNFADINLDGKISIADVVLLMRYVNGQIDTIPFIVS